MRVQDELIEDSISLFIPPSLSLPISLSTMASITTAQTGKA